MTELLLKIGKAQENTFLNQNKECDKNRKLPTKKDRKASQSLEGQLDLP